MAVKFGMTVVEIIGQLTRGFMKAMGRKPDGLEKIKIQQEAVQRFKDMNKVVDMEGNILDPSKPIMGGTQEGAALRSGIMRATGARPKTLIEKAIDDASPGFSGDRKVDAELVAENLAERMGKVYDDMPTKERLKIYDEAFQGLTKKRFDPDGMADGGRIGYKLGSIDKARRAFLKTAAGVGGGIAALKTGLLGLSKKAPEAIETVKETVSGAVDKVPPYFFRLVEKIRFMGEETLASQDKAIAKKYKDYVMEEDFAGNITIVKRGEDLQGNKLEDVYMSYKVDDVATKDKKGFARAEEYEEFTARPDMEGKMKDVEPGVPEEVIEEAGDVDAMTLKRASGGIARMLGE